MRNNVKPLPILLIIIIFLLGCTEQESSIIRAEQDAIFFGKKKIANTADVASQDSLFVEDLRKELESKKDTSKNCQIKIDPELSYDLLYKIAATCELSGYTDFSIVYAMDEKDYVLPFSLDSPNDTFMDKVEREREMGIDPPIGACCFLNLTIIIEKDFFEVWVAGGSYPKIFHKENLDSAYNQLANWLIKINGLNDFSESDSGTIITDTDTKISYIISVIHRLKETGFAKIDVGSQPIIIDRLNDSRMFFR